MRSRFPELFRALCLSTLFVGLQLVLVTAHGQPPISVPAVPGSESTTEPAPAPPAVDSPAAIPDPLPGTYSTAVGYLRSGRFSEAYSVFSYLIDKDAQDPRLRFLRGAAAEQLGMSGETDFRTAARLERKLRSPAPVNRALELLQGPLRVQIERIRRETRLAARPEDKVSTNRSHYAAALDALAIGDTTRAHEEFTAAIDNDTIDPRPFYQRALLSRAAGEQDSAEADVREGIRRENSSRFALLVDQALRGVQGPDRIWLEKQVALTVDGQEITRADNRLAIILSEEKQEEALLAADAEERRRLLEAAQEQRRQDLMAAAERFRAGLDAESSDDAALNTTVAQPAMPAPTEEPAVAANDAPAAAPSATTTPPGALLLTPPPEVSLNDSASSGTSASAGAPIDFTWMPDNADVIVHARPGALLGSPFFQPVMQSPQAQMAMTMASSQSGINPTDIESVTFGVGNVMPLIVQAVMQAQQGQGGAAPNPGEIMQKVMIEGGAVSVMKTKSKLDPMTMSPLAPPEERSHNGTTYYVMAGQNGAPDSALWPYDDTTYIQASETVLTALIDSGPGTGPGDRFTVLPESPHFGFAFSNPTLAAMSGGIPTPQNAPPPVQALVNAIKGKVTGVALILDADRDLTLSVKLPVSDQSAADEAAAQLEALAGMGQQMYQGMGRAQVPPPLQPVADKAVQSLAAASDDSTAAVSVTIPGELVTTLMENPQILGGLMGAAMGAGGPGGGGPGGGAVPGPGPRSVPE